MGAAAAITSMAFGQSVAEAAPAEGAPMTCTISYRWLSAAYDGVGGSADGTGSCVDQASGQRYQAEISSNIMNSSSVGCPPRTTFFVLALTGGPKYTLRWDQLSVPGAVGGLVNGVVPGILPLPPLPNVTIGSLNSGIPSEPVGVATLVGTLYCDVRPNPTHGHRATRADGQLTMTFLAPAPDRF